MLVQYLNSTNLKRVKVQCSKRLKNKYKKSENFTRIFIDYFEYQFCYHIYGKLKLKIPYVTFPAFNFFLTTRNFNVCV